ncbi:MAG: hypothetical protein ABIZ34_07850, partial [Candidatus Limnocylindrales bacterium]
MDPWTSFLAWLQSLIVPDWNAVISILPLLLVLGVVGPILSLMMLMQVWYLLHRQRGHVRVADADARPAERGSEGDPIFAANVPFCEKHALVYPANIRICEIDRVELSVRCPIDSTTRPATQELCRACGTR